MTMLIVCVAMTGIAVAAAFMLVSGPERRLAIMLGAVWLASVAIGFLFLQPPITLVFVGSALAGVSVLNPRAGVFLYIGALAAFPLSYDYLVPFPGLNYLISLDYGKMATIILLGPAFLRSLSKPAPRTLRQIGQMLLFFSLFTGIMSIRELPFTSMARIVVDQLLLIYVPFVAISRTLTTREDVDKALQAFFISLAILAVIGFVSAFRSWNYYAHITTSFSAKSFFDYRNGILRVQATVIPTLLGFLAIASLLLLWVRTRQKRTPFIYALAAAPVFAFAAFATGARGGWLGGMVAIGAFVVLHLGGAALRRLMIAGIGVALVGGIYLVLNDSDAFQDKYGSVSYRADLIRTSIDQIMERPFFGSSDFINTPRFERLRQGEGIIDLVNGFIQIVLYYGLTGLALFVGVHALALRGGLKALASAPPTRRAGPAALADRRNMAFLLALHLGYLAMIATVSFVSYIPHYGYIILALVVAQVRVLANAPASSETVSSDAVAPAAPPEEATTPRAATPAGPTPYGGRFVRRQ